MKLAAMPKWSRKIYVLVIVLIIITLLSQSNYFNRMIIPVHASSGQWSSTQAMTTARTNHTLTLLAGGNVLAVGGLSNTVVITSSELYNPVAGTWVATGSLFYPRDKHTATLLQSGKVLVTGGENQGGTALASAELYDPQAGTWSVTGALVNARSGHTATLLQSGKVLVVGGGMTTTELYDPQLGTWSLTGALTNARAGHTATLLQNGNVLVAGGGSTIAELYDPQLGTWSLTGQMLAGRANHTATLLNSGKVFVTSGASGNPGTELYDPGTGTWSAGPNMPYYNMSYINDTAILLANGKVFVLISYQYINYSYNPTELYDPDLNSWAYNVPLVSSLLSTPAILLANGNVLVAGGLLVNPKYRDSAPTANAEIYNPLYTTNSVTGAGGTWSTAGRMSVNRAQHTATLLQNGQVLIAGGFVKAAPDDYYCLTNPCSYMTSPTAELYEPGTGRWHDTGQMSVRRVDHTATLLQNGQVLVAGGGSASAELYNPQTGVWTLTGTMSNVRSNHTATLLPNGKVLVTGGYPATNSAELYDPGTGLWSPAGTMSTARLNHTATLLNNGKVLVAGGITDRNTPHTLLDSAEIYDPQTNSWSATTPMKSTRYSHTATLLNNGKVLLVGGMSTNITVESSAELYDPVNAGWTNVGSFLDLAQPSNTATLLPDGRVLVAGGPGGYFPFNTDLGDPRAGLFDPATNLWSVTGFMAQGRSFFTATLLNNGNVLVSGGYNKFLLNPIGSAELYNNTLPVATFTYTPSYPIMINTTIVFTDTSPGNSTGWSWSFGDGTTSSIPNPSHVYTTSGVYTVTLTITNSNGTTSLQTPLPVGPLASFNYTPVHAPINSTITFTDTSTGGALNWTWVFGDGSSPVFTQNATHLYTATGIYTVTLNSSNQYGLGLINHTVYIEAPPTASFIYTLQPVTATGATVVFTDTAQNGPTQWYWDFGDGTNSNSENPSHNYLATGNYSVTLTISNSAGLSSITRLVKVSLLVIMASDNGQGNNSGTLSLALKAAKAGDLITFGLSNTSVISETLGPLNVPVGVMIMGSCTAGVPGIVIDGSLAGGGPPNGLILHGNDTISGLFIKGFPGSELLVQGSGNHTSCLKVSK